MPRKKRTARDPLLVEIYAALGSVPLKAAWLEDEDAPESLTIYGLCQPGRGATSSVVINEAAHITDTLVHECIHAVRPSWSEQTVRRRTTMLCRQLSNEEVQRIYDVYLGRRERGKRVKV